MTKKQASIFKKGTIKMKAPLFNILILSLILSYASDQSKAFAEEKVEAPSKDQVEKKSDSNKVDLAKYKKLFRSAENQFLAGRVTRAYLIIEAINQNLEKADISVDKVRAQKTEPVKRSKRSLYVSKMLGQLKTILFKTKFDSQYVADLQRRAAKKYQIKFLQEPSLNPESLYLLEAEVLLNDCIKRYKSESQKTKLAQAELILADVYMHQTRNWDAERQFKKVLSAVDKESVKQVSLIKTYEGLLNVLFRQGKMEEYKTVFAEYKSLIDDHKVKPSTYAVARSYRRMGQYDRAEALIKSSSNKGDDLEAYPIRAKLELAFIHLKRGEYNASSRLLKSAREGLSRYKKQNNKTSKNDSFCTFLERKLAQKIENDSGGALIGLHTDKLKNRTRQSLGLDKNSFGVIVKSVKPGSIAAGAGIVYGDLIKSIDRRVLTLPVQLNSYLNSIRSDKELSLVIEREGKEKNIKIKFEPEFKNDKKAGALQFDKQAVESAYKGFIKAYVNGDRTELRSLIDDSFFTGDITENKNSVIEAAYQLKKSSPTQTFKSVILDIEGSGDEALVRTVDFYRSNAQKSIGGRPRFIKTKGIQLANNYLKATDGTWKVVAMKNIDSLSKVSFGYGDAAQFLLESDELVKTGADYSAKFSVEHPKMYKVDKEYLFFRAASDDKEKTSSRRYLPLKEKGKESTFTATESNGMETVVAGIKFVDPINKDILGVVQLSKLVPTVPREKTFDEKLNLSFLSKVVLEQTKTKGEGPEAVVENIFDALKSAADKDNLDALIGLADFYLDRKEFKLAVDTYSNAAKRGSAEAQLKLYKMSISPYGSKAISYRKGLYWLKKATAQKYPEAMVTYARTLRNITAAVKIFEEAAKLGSDSAKFELGSMYMEGYGVDKDISKGLNYYRAAIKNNYSPAEYKLGTYYLAKAIYWLDKAAKDGHYLADSYIRKMIDTKIVRSKGLINRLAKSYEFEDSGSSGGTGEF